MSYSFRLELGLGVLGLLCLLGCGGQNTSLVNLPSAEHMLSSSSGAGTIKNDNSGKCLVGSGSSSQYVSVTESACSSASDEQFVLVQTSNGYYNIKDSSQTICFGVSGNSASQAAVIVQGPCNGTENQQYMPVALPSSSFASGAYQLKVLSTQLCLRIGGTGGTLSSTAGVTELDQEDCNDTYGSEAFFLDPPSSSAPTPVPSGTPSTIKNSNSQDCLVSSGSGSPTTHSSCSSSASNQQFELVSISGGYYNIMNSAKNLCLGVAGGSSSSGALVEEESCNESLSQEFKPVAMSSFSGYYELVVGSTQDCLRIAAAGATISSTAGVTELDQEPCNSTYGSEAFELSGLNSPSPAPSPSPSPTSSPKPSPSPTPTNSPPPTGSYNEPAGMNMQIDTGPMNNPPSQVGSGSWTEGTAKFQNYGPSTMSSMGDWSGNISAVPDGTGMRVNYPATTMGANAPVVFGAPIPSTGTGYLYIRFLLRMSPNWSYSKAIGNKILEPSSVVSGNNDVFALNAGDTSGNATPTGNAWPQFLLQGNQVGDIPGGKNATGVPPYDSAPASIFTNSGANVLSPANIGKWNLVEIYLQPELPLNTGNNGQFTVWINGVLQWTSVGKGSTGINYDSGGWYYLMFDPTYGGDPFAGDHAPDPSTNGGYAIYWDIDQLYVGTK